MVGIDVSKWNGGIDFNKVKSAGVNFVIIRAGFGVNGIDRLFKANYTAAKEAGLKIGAYWYSYAKTAAEAEQEVAVCLSVPPMSKPP